MTQALIDSKIITFFLNRIHTLQKQLKFTVVMLHMLLSFMCICVYLTIRWNMCRTNCDLRISKWLCHFNMSRTPWRWHKQMPL